ncbi:MAG: Glu/Leu/Phe/Val dehydrogenase dimerization domain-containing protein [Pseudomonadota bacterium]|nr:Glu/Leu/Phe/Val dehydrogenase dimerization domain-containing protein [Pseudomonadota bacterium]MEC9235737.1 Glu/Leu/Phe/Val dehydrogenase dimerization domain-containing protein [Pseudomonadota bacterium]MED5424097.1 Glu/Leu/Phe/Val dehydrogenase dimerization domain-containing protein [Pseudomonadota bacterium]
MALTFTYPDLSNHPAFDNHEKILCAEDTDIGFKAYIALHNTRRGPARGGCRYWASYENDNEAIGDVLRLSKGMTFKNALAGLQYGGGKTVIVGKKGTKTPDPAFMEALGHALNELGGAYETGEDVGTRTEDFRIAGHVTDYVRVKSLEKVGAVDLAGGPPLYTAFGVYYGIKAAVKFKFGQDSLKGIRFAVKGLGNVASSLCKLLYADGAKLTVCDIDAEKVKMAAELWGARVVRPEDIIVQNVDVYVPCALGGDINSQSLPLIKAKVIAGAANNQLATPDMATALKEQGILYAPDYAINAGGVINVVEIGASHEDLIKKVQNIGTTLMEIFVRAEREDKTTAEIADIIALERIF